MRTGFPRLVPIIRFGDLGASETLAISLLCLAACLTGCGNNSVSSSSVASGSVPGVYESKQDRRGYNRRGDIVVFGETRTLDFRSDGSFVWTYDHGKDAEGYSGGSREVTTGKWESSGGKVVCYNGDGSVFSAMKQEGSDLIIDETRYRRITAQSSVNITESRIEPVDISGNWIEPSGLSEDTFATWTLKKDGSFSKKMTLWGKSEDSETGSYKIRSPRPSPDSIPGDIVECSSPKWKSPTFFRIPPNSSTLLVKVNCDDDSFSGSRPNCWVTKEGASPVTLQASDEECVYTGKVVSIERSTNGLSLVLDTKVHGKKLECAMIDDDIPKLGDVKKLEGKKVEVKGRPEEFWCSVLLFIDADDLKILE
jgi:hypothetical protein